MAARQRLRTVLDARRASRPCWRCALNLSRHNSTIPTGIPSSSNRTDEVPYSRILEQGSEETLKSHAPDLPSNGAELARGLLDESESGSSQRVRKPRIRVMWDGRPVPLHGRSEFVSSAPQEPRIRVMWDGRSVALRTRSGSISPTPLEPRIRRVRVETDGQQVVSGMEPQPNSMTTMQRPRITRFISNDRPRPLRIRSIPIASAPQEPRIWRVRVETNGQKVASGTEPQSNSLATMRRPRITRIVSHGRAAPERTEPKSKPMETTQKPRIRVMQDGRTVPLRSQPEFTSLYPNTDRRWRIRVNPLGRVLIRRMSVMPDGRQVASSIELQPKSTEITQKLRRQPMQENTDVQPATSSTRSQSQTHRAVKEPSIRMVSTGPPKFLSTRDFLRSKQVEQSLPLRKVKITRSILKDVSVFERGLDPFIRPFSSITPPVAEAPDVVSKKLSERKVRPLVRTYIATYAAPLEGEDEAYHDELTSVLDVYRELHASKLSNPTKETGHSFSSTRFSPLNSVRRRLALSESRTLNQPSLSTSIRSFSSRTSWDPKRQYATATVSKTRMLLVIRPLKPSTESDYEG